MLPLPGPRISTLVSLSQGCARLDREASDTRLAVGSIPTTPMTRRRRVDSTVHRRGVVQLDRTRASEARDAGSIPAASVSGEVVQPDRTLVYEAKDAGSSPALPINYQHRWCSHANKHPVEGCGVAAGSDSKSLLPSSILGTSDNVGAR